MPRIPGVAPGKRKKRKNGNGHWFVYMLIIALVVGLWAIPLDTLSSEVDDMGAKIGLLSRVARTVAQDLTVTVKSLGTLLAGAIGLLYIWYNRRKAG